ncbi:transporter substrate-binding domain-containing protein [Legionella hackeliae]|uniref:Putative arginine 3rd transport system periplasmic binding protein n=1 Tax=Legionella hackeliae TaxID=449 RepID=A0A0A8UPN5_LEGHA|nr:transporter substrate-binding domain-containing protein [Legionella hackeliae]KTD14893.1 arginine ABC transporter substrate-binding protein [Legionella hackeliae]CEK09481.1 putative arginine 3rd transport system periplasmic binding protein [Legionella hackeliae]STX49387.1 arginine ABC transporter substrate-binding protein [Legionella hackeliae]
MKFFCIACCFFYSICLSANPKIIIGTPVFNPPYVIASPAITQGFDIDLMNAICSKLQWDCSYKSFAFIDLLDAIRNNEVDLAIGSIVITPDRRQEFIFSIPYLPCDGGFTVLKDSPVKNVDDLQGKRIGALRPREYYHYLAENFIDQFTIIPYDHYQDIFLDLKSGKLDAVFGNYFSGLYLAHQYPNDVRVLTEHFQIGEGLGIIASPINQDKITQINKAILQFQVDGTFIGLYNYNFEFFTQHPNISN